MQVAVCAVLGSRALAQYHREIGARWRIKTSHIAAAAAADEDEVAVVCGTHGIRYQLVRGVA